MRGMRDAKGSRSASATGWGFVAAGVMGLAACGGEAKQAEGPATPADTAVHGSDDSSSAGSAGATPSGGSSSSAPSGGDSASASSDSSGAPAGPKTPYDKDSVEIELRKAARQVKSNCGSATDDSGSSPGPWGKTSASITLGRNGHVKSVAVPAPYDGQPDGNCAVNAFKKIQFPPYASSSDVVVDWDIELVKPKH